ncbi:uncharacterized protein EAF01_001116 [Botrytis porri]|uniref:uncharacterized protein n=1 Tax=Botrytis porri TaxID=87229 RepID=UPI001900178F|nr:uncharacterized protein EAF01_001116 [Botrytis porri]KAF7912095.1 hypothetical protein EAF01_001116 [Botrytis porri]
MIGGACWKCRILGKKSTEENPCDTCPKRNKAGKTAWTQIGCKRGTLSEEMESIDLCRNHIPSQCLLVSIFFVFNAGVVGVKAQTRMKANVQDATVIGPFISDLKIVAGCDSCKS